MNRTAAIEKYNCDDIMVDTARNSRFSCMSRIMPCLTQNSSPYHLQLDRPLLDEERWMVHGIPVLNEVQDMTGLQLPYDLDCITAKNQLDMIGNGQSTVVMGALQLWYAAGTMARKPSQPELPLCTGREQARAPEEEST